MGGRALEGGSISAWVEEPPSRSRAASLASGRSPRGGGASRSSRWISIPPLWAGSVRVVGVERARAGAGADDVPGQAMGIWDRSGREREAVRAVTSVASQPWRPTAASSTATGSSWVVRAHGRWGCGERLALRAVPVPTGVVGGAFEATRAAHVEMLTELGRPAQRDGREHPALGERQVHLGFERSAVLDVQPARRRRRRRSRRAMARAGQRRVAALARDLDVTTFPTHARGSQVMSLRGRVSTYAGTIPDLPLFSLLDLERAIRTLDWLSRRVHVEAPWRGARAATWDGASLDAWIDCAMLSRRSRSFARCDARRFRRRGPRGVAPLHALLAARGRWAHAPRRGRGRRAAGAGRRRRAGALDPHGGAPRRGRRPLGARSRDRGDRGERRPREPRRRSLGRRNV